MSCCLYCNKEVNHLVASTLTTFYVRGTKVNYNELSAHCPICAHEIYISELDDQNCMNREKAYQQAVKETNG